MYMHDIVRNAIGIHMSQIRCIFKERLNERVEYERKFVALQVEL